MSERDWIAWLRACGGNDAKRAYAEAEKARADASTPKVGPEFARDMRALAKRAEAVRIGTSVHDAELPVALALSDIAGSGHALVLGASGAGKTRLVAHVAREIVRRQLAGAEAPNLFIMDHKGEFAPFVLGLVGQLLEALPEAEARAYAARIGVVNPFSTEALVPMGLLLPDPGVEIEVHAFDVASLLMRLGGDDMGARQDAFLYQAVLLGVHRRMTLVELVRLLGDPLALAGAAHGVADPDLRAYFARPDRIAGTSLEGVRARLSRLLRLRATRLMLGAESTVPMTAMIDRPLVLVNLGDVPAGCEDIPGPISQFLLLRLTRAIFARPHGGGVRPLAVLMDEWQEALERRPQTAEQLERLLSMARSRRVSFWLISQSLAVAGRVAPALPRVASTNASLYAAFRASQEDAHAFAELLPLTGRRVREERRVDGPPLRSPYLTLEEERRAIRAGIASLPDRTFYRWNRRKPYPAELVRVDEVKEPPRRGRSGDLAERLERGGLAVPVADLARAAERGTARQGVATPPADARPDNEGAASARARRPRARAVPSAAQADVPQPPQGPVLTGRSRRPRRHEP